MNNFPLLFFDSPTTEKRSNLKNGYPSSFLNVPIFKRQVERLGPIFSNLQTTLNTRKMYPQISALGLEPECTVVMEIVGAIEDFMSIVRNTEGLEWLAELNEELDPDEDFYYNDQSGNKIDKHLKNKLFISMANQKAIDELIRCWELYSKNPNVELGKGKAKLKDIFRNLHNIRRWSVEDRIENSYLFENWKSRIEDGAMELPLEIELWYREDSKKRKIAEDIVKYELEGLGGKVVYSCVIEEIKYHAILAKIPASIFDKIKKHQEIEMLKCEEIMYFNPTAQSSIKMLDINQQDLLDCDEQEKIVIDNNPILAVLDGIPIANHQYLENTLIINDVDEIGSRTPVEKRLHGTAVCSLIMNGDMSKQENKLSHKIYVRPILDSNGNISENLLPVDITFRAINEIIKDDKLGQAIKIINLSVGDYYRQFNKNISAWAKLIDYFSYKYNLLFCISTGNYSEPIDLNCTLEEWNNLSEELRIEKILNLIRNTEKDRKLLAPAESINAITVGAINDDFSNFSEDNNGLELIKNNIFPSIISRMGLGFRNSIKPDICVEGGRQLYEKPFIESKKLENLKIKNFPTRAPGLCVAYGNNKQAFFSGTSFACALASRAAAQFYEIIETIATGIPTYISVLLKAMLVHCCSWNDFDNILKNILNIDSWMVRKRFVSKSIGYGKANFSRLYNCNPQRVTAITANNIEKDEMHTYRFPMPKNLIGKKRKFKLTMTLAWFSPINYNNSKYRRAKLWIDCAQDETFKSMVSNAKIEADIKNSLRGTVQHLIYEDSKALAYVEGTDLIIKVNCLSEDGRKLGGVNYGLAITLEIKDDNQINIYEEIKDRMVIQEKVRTRVQ